MMYRYLVCQNPDCGLRFPAPQPAGERCPRCSSLTAEGGFPTHTSSSTSAATLKPRLKGALLDNLRSAYNVGAIFRTADGAGLERLYLGGITPTPTTARLEKTALGAEKSVPWEQGLNGVGLAARLIDAGHTLWGLEETPQAENLFRFVPPPKEERPILVVGNEVVGIDPAILALCSHVLALPMWGKKRSLNVTVAFGTAVYALNHRS